MSYQCMGWADNMDISSYQTSSLGYTCICWLESCSPAPPAHCTSTAAHAPKCQTARGQACAHGPLLPTQEGAQPLLAEIWRHLLRQQVLHRSDTSSRGPKTWQSLPWRPNLQLQEGVFPWKQTAPKTLNCPPPSSILSLSVLSVDINSSSSYI